MKTKQNKKGPTNCVRVWVRVCEELVHRKEKHGKEMLPLERTLSLATCCYCTKYPSLIPKNDEVVRVYYTWFACLMCVHVCVYMFHSLNEVANI